MAPWTHPHGDPWIHFKAIREVLFFPRPWKLPDRLSWFQVNSWPINKFVANTSLNRPYCLHYSFFSFEWQLMNVFNVTKKYQVAAFPKFYSNPRTTLKSFETDWSDIWIWCMNAAVLVRTSTGFSFLAAFFGYVYCGFCSILSRLAPASAAFATMFSTVYIFLLNPAGLVWERFTRATCFPAYNPRPIRLCFLLFFNKSNRFSKSLRIYLLCWKLR